METVDDDEPTDMPIPWNLAARASSWALCSGLSDCWDVLTESLVDFMFPAGI